MLDPLLALETAPALVRMTMATDTATSVSAWAAIGSVIVTLVLAVLTGAYVWQTRSMARAAVDSARVAEASAEHAARSADAAERSLISSNMPALLASWVSDSSELRGAEFDVRNDGRSPAINVHITYDDQKERIGDFDPGERRKMRRALIGEVDSDGRYAAKGLIAIEYEDLAGHRYQSECLLTAIPSRAMNRVRIRSNDTWLPVADLGAEREDVP